MKNYIFYNPLSLTQRITECGEEKLSALQPKQGGMMVGKGRGQALSLWLHLDEGPGGIQPEKNP